MAQVENPGNLDRWRNPAYRVPTLLLIRCGLRMTDAARLAFNCIVQDQEGAPYLRYYNHKMKREALVPIDEQLHAEIGRQQQRVQDRYPAAAPAVLFPRPLKNAAGNMPLSGSTYRQALCPWLERCDIRDQHGQPIHLTPHQWRHTLVICTAFTP
jgi:integrase